MFLTQAMHHTKSFPSRDSSMTPMKSLSVSHSCLKLVWYFFMGVEPELGDELKRFGVVYKCVIAQISFTGNSNRGFWLVHSQPVSPEVLIAASGWFIYDPCTDIFGFSKLRLRFPRIRPELIGISALRRKIRS